VPVAVTRSGNRIRDGDRSISTESRDARRLRARPERYRLSAPALGLTRTASDRV